METVQHCLRPCPSYFRIPAVPIASRNNMKPGDRSETAMLGKLIGVDLVAVF